MAWQEIGQLIERWCRALDEEGLAYGDRVAILVPNGIEHVAMYQAVLSRGLVPVPLHRRSTCRRTSKRCGRRS
jgi:long-chain acyl-CoA synthetase